MNRPSIVRRPIIKGLQLHRWPLTLYFLLGLLSLYLLTIEVSGPFYAGAVLLQSMVIATGAHLVLRRLTNEREDQTMVLIMSQPISYRQYSLSKVCANLLAYGAVWLPLLLGLVLVIHSQPQIPDGLTEYAVILMLELLTVFVLLLSVGLITESRTWVIVLITTTIIGVSIFMRWTSSIPAINAHMTGPEADPHRDVNRRRGVLDSSRLLGDHPLATIAQAPLSLIRTDDPDYIPHLPRRTFK